MYTPLNCTTAQPLVDFRDLSLCSQEGSLSAKEILPGQHPPGVRINCGNISGFMLMLTKYVAVYLPIILSLFLLLKRHVDLKI